MLRIEKKLVAFVVYEAILKCSSAALWEKHSNLQDGSSYSRIFYNALVSWLLYMDTESLPFTWYTLFGNWPCYKMNVMKSSIIIILLY